jgi:Protein of unknown function (DUF3306)
MTQPGDENEGFLNRWSRLKRKEAATQEPTRPSEPAPPAAGAAVAPLKTLEEIIAELPKLEDLVPGQDLSLFMRAEVPTALRNQALRRMWLIDPAIRDFVGEALDYGYDYNTPGAVPGYGALTADPEQVKAVLDLFDRVASADPTGNDNLSQGGPAGGRGGPAHAAAQQDAAPQPPSETGEDVDRPEIPDPAAEAAPIASEIGAPDHAAMQEIPTKSGASRRRHGGALPG